MSSTVPAKRPLLIVGASCEQVPLIEKARAGGWSTVVMDYDSAAPGLALADVPAVESTRDVQAAVRLGREHGVRAVLTTASESAILTVAETCRELGLPGLPVEAARQSTDKSLMKQCFLKAGLPTSDFRVVARASEAQRAAHEIGFPCIIKPCDGAGSRGVLRTDSAQEVEEAFRSALEASKLGRCLVEGYEQGIELSADAFLSGGRAQVLGIADKEKEEGGQGRANVAMNIVYPPRFDDDETAQAEDLVGRAALAVGIEDGPVHVELMRTGPGRFSLLEIGARGGGFHTFSKVMPAISGVDTLQALIELALGRRPPVVPTRRQAAALRFAGSSGRHGRITRLAGLSQVRSLPGVLEAGFLKNEGDCVRPVSQDGDRIAYWIVSGKNRAHVLSLSQRVKDLVCIDIEESAQVQEQKETHSEDQVA
ncbi:MAG TPA: ATP-grasp domain-containing protein [Acidobacteriota bacterium]|nr:ATP-grasp domain-containing protein [Acidobacteriota bacterium]